MLTPPPRARIVLCMITHDELTPEQRDVLALLGADQHTATKLHARSDHSLETIQRTLHELARLGRVRAVDSRRGYWERT